MGRYKVNLIAVFSHKRSRENNVLSRHALKCAEECKEARLVATKNFLPNDIQPEKILCQCRDEMSTLEFAKFIMDISAENSLDNILVVSDKKHIRRLVRDLKKVAPKYEMTESEREQRSLPKEACKISGSCPSEDTDFTLEKIKNWFAWWMVELPKRIIPWKLYAILAA